MRLWKEGPTGFARAFWILLLLFAPPAAFGGVGGSPGDFNTDGAFNLADLDLLYAEILSGNNDPGFDLTNDGTVDQADLFEWLRLGAEANGLGSPYKLGDANLDGFVDGSDFLIWNANRFTSRRSWGEGDFDADGLVDGRDHIAWNSNKFTSSRGGAAGPFRMFLDRLTGTLWLDTQGDDFVTLLVEGIEADSIETLADGDVLDGQSFRQTFFSGFEQWVRVSPLSQTGISGLYPMAIYPAGTTTEQVRTWTLATDDGSVRFGRVEDFCVAGNVNFGAGSVADVLKVNGLTGRFFLATGQSIELTLEAPPAGPALARYCLWIWLGDQTNPVTLGGSGEILGCTANPTPLQPGMSPQPFRCMRGGVPSIVCGSVPERIDFDGDGAVKAAPASAPFSLSRAGGLIGPIVFDLQGILEDSGSANGSGFSITNRVTLVVRAP